LKDRGRGRGEGTPTGEIWMAVGAGKASGGKGVKKGKNGVLAGHLRAGKTKGPT